MVNEKMIFVVINKIDLFEDLLHEFRQQKIYGGTIFDTMGMASVMGAEPATSGLGLIRGMLNKGRPFNKTIMMLCNDEEIEKVRKAVDKIIGPIDEIQNAGVIFSLPVEGFWGINKQRNNKFDDEE